VTRRAAALTWTETEARAARLLVVPLGATEQHGPHLPASTDTDIADALAGALAQRRADVLVAPVVAYGASGEHADFPGTLSIGHEALRLLLVELCRSATRTWPHVLLLSTHGGNVGTVGDAVQLLQSEGRDVRAWSPRWRGDAHAGRTETSVQLSLASERMRAGELVRGNTMGLSELLPELRRAGVRAVSPKGVLGDATGATAVEGARLLEAAAADLEAVVGEWLGAA
jgi:mycofactocin system creatininase family protein